MARTATHEELRHIASEAGLAPHADAIAEAARVGIVLADAGAAAGAPGESRLGGLADLPATITWPAWRNRPMATIAQFRLSELAAVDDLLPPSGLLFFFWDSGAVGACAGGDEVADEAGWGFDPADAASARIVFVEDEAAAAPRDAPPGLVPEAVLGARAVRPFPRLTIPPWASTAFEDLPVNTDPGSPEVDAYFDLLDALDRAQGIGDGPIHQLLGHPDQIQNDMQLECQLVTHGLYCGDEREYQDPRRVELEPGAREWRLLLQIDTDEDGLGVMWGDVGRIYFWIRDADLAARRFDAVWLVFQCY